MTAYLLTEQQHAQIVDALQYCYDVDSYPASGESAQDNALAMLKGLKPVEPACYGWRGNDGAVRDCIAPDTHAIIEGQYSVPLYTLADTA